MSGGRRRARLIGLLSVAALLAFNFPLILIWDRDATFAGLPLLPLALFALWALVILFAALLGETRRRPARRD